jgi:hypothetical protein
MALWTADNGQLKAALAGKNQFVEEDILTTDPDVFVGPSATSVRNAFQDLLGWLKVTDKPWAQGAENYHGIGVNNTYWVLGKSPNRGIWVLNATSAEAAKNAQDARAASQYGFYLKATDQLPTIKDILASGLIFGKGFTDAYYRNFPEQDDRPKPPKPRPVVPVKTYEIFGMLNGEPVPLTDVLFRAGPGDWVLADGADVMIGDSPEDGFNLGGDPGVGKWNAYYAGKSPQDFGLDPDKGVLRWDGSKGVVMDAATLKDIYSPENWKLKVY